MFIRIFQYILFLTSLSFTITRAQMLDSALVVDTTKIFSGKISPRPNDQKSVKNEMKVTYENGIKIVGTKTFDVGIKEGVLNSKSGTTTYSDEGRNEIAQALKELSGSENPSNMDIRQIIYVNDEVLGKTAYLIFKNGVASASPDSKEEQFRAVMMMDKSEVFIHDGAIFTSPSGAMIATTPTNLIVITGTKTAGITYEILFGAIPPLKKPTISGGKNPDEVFIRDETMTDGTNAVRLELDLKTLDITVKDDSK